MLTVPDLLEHLKTWDEITLIEYLGLTSEDIVDRFADVIEEKYDTLDREVWEELYT